MFVLFTHSDVKRLAEKEDWVVDNEGITSLVRTRQDVGHIIMRNDPADCQSHVRYALKDAHQYQYGTLSHCFS